jgi:hypothetical protein
MATKRKDPSEYLPTGRPSKYTPEIARDICEKLSEGIPLRQICRQEGYPAWQKIYEWMQKDPELSGAIARARDMGYDWMAEECIEIADNATNDWMEEQDEDGNISWRVNGEHIQRSKLRIETRLKLLAKFNPKKYSDKIVQPDEISPMAIQINLGVFKDVIESIKQQRQVETIENK